ncbi:prephenate dehydratase [Quadrisphaera granulorum]|uniref:Prephenate dehydratase n=1 Tax=Quadrisphaera granulorum TaxID=317664 RepID=A0A316AZQ0_9ACTN|nr:prephenate dehydratase [Quadrisphaera granulorum]PWJ55707.1 prephenate dehydratase [Quadrisphaera granulorum]SZE95204.1 prephenate dehydratase [Quadrisphaera granulorum]
MAAPGISPSGSAPSRRVVYLGPAGTFTETAVGRAPGTAGAERVPVASVDAALAAVRDGEADLAVVPIENSVEGGVTSTLDALGAGRPLSIRAEVLVPVAFVLAVRPGTTMRDILRVGSHPHALAQCRGWVAQNLPQAVTVPALSTAAAAQVLAGEGEAPYDAALCAEPAAVAAGLDVLARDVADNAGAVTRFVVVSRPAAPPAPTGSDKTTVVAALAEDRSGALLELLEQFATRGINLTRIESRPVGTALGRYTFSIDCEGHVADPRVGEALMGLHRVCPQVRYLGSYPRADGLAPVPPPGTSDDDFTAARSWLSQLLECGEVSS